MTTPRLVTARLVLEPVRVGDAAEMGTVLADPELYTFIGDGPPSAEELRDRYRRWQSGGSDDGAEEWHNWVMRLRADRAEAAEHAGVGDGGERPAVGTMQATVYRTRRTADVAWIVGRRWQRQGLASEAAIAVVTWLRPNVDEITAHVHPLHAASSRVAARAGLVKTDRIEDGEVVWALRSRVSEGLEP